MPIAQAGPRPSVTHDRLSELIGSIYDCVLDPANWQRVLAEIAGDFHFDNALLGVLRLDTGETILGAAAGLDETSLARVLAFGSDVVESWGGAERIQQLPMDEPVLWSQAVARRTVPVSRYHREWVEPRGLIDAIAIGIVRDTTMIGNVAFGRHNSAGPIGSGEIDGLRLLAPHLRRAVIIGNLFEMKAIEAATLGSALDALASPMVLVDDSLGIIHANAAARQMLAARTPIRSDNGALTLPAAVSHGALARAVRDAAGDAIALGAKGIGIPAPGPDDNSYVVHVLPLKPGEMRRGIAPRVAAALFVTSAGATPRVPADALALLFDLTPAETRVLELIVAGKTRSEIADTLGIAQSTLKTHLLRLFDKTGSSRQADLVRLATRLSLPA